MQRLEKKIKTKTKEDPIELIKVSKDYNTFWDHTKRGSQQFKEIIIKNFDCKM